MVFLITLPPDALSTAADMAGALGGSHVKDPPLLSSPLLELNQLSEPQEAGIALKSERSIDPKHDWKSVPSQTEAQPGVMSSDSLSPDAPTPGKASLKQDITLEAVSLSMPVLAVSTGKGTHQYVMRGCVCTVQELDVYASSLK